MRHLIILGLSLFYNPLLIAQTSIQQPNGFATFEEFKQNKPSLTISFILKHRDDGDIFMMGGIANYRLKKVKPESLAERGRKRNLGC